VRLIDALVRAWERAEILLAMNEGDLDWTLVAARTPPPTQAAFWTRASCLPRAQTPV